VAPHAFGGWRWGQLGLVGIHGVSSRASTRHFEDVANVLIELGPYSADFSKGELILLTNRSDFDSAIPWFESRRAQPPTDVSAFGNTALIELFKIWRIY
jgi:hypothetical protein